MGTQFINVHSYDYANDSFVILVEFPKTMYNGFIKGLINTIKRKVGSNF